MRTYEDHDFKRELLEDELEDQRIAKVEAMPLPEKLSLFTDEELKREDNLMEHLSYSIKSYYSVKELIDLIPSKDVPELEKILKGLILDGEKDR